ncbi:penicillin-binding protein [Burkholderia stagnalis]|uniref:Penicillin-binding protein n=1 Tax=Burkholderia stagnalis TaxID=1503054 RepID=A0ABX9YPD8_9BURK|nr:transglycosylase domain-containing protein [Burkholderia stagnalis]RQQ60633.1 penicillin-binding protein [Burkholderia stagnalis]RQQ70273.1 penicillin-binding protein [Burkholderia stagnalis]RQQ71309.1 penicillin-binding protein [Burkholderia stagnalis]RQQ83431.1 penicillin-binding protein [Burkholderia stagnalis]RQQ91447.1 penicillin-binding protein [Burkholderia stagnalis]
MVRCCLSSRSPIRVNRRNVSSVRDLCAKWIARAQPVAAAAAAPVKRLLAVAWFRLRHPTRRGVVLAVAAVPALFLLYVLALVPFTPGIGDIRKARVDQPAQVLSADGKLLAEFKPSNREWVALKQISPHMIDALIATEDHRFYEHHGLDWRRTAGAALHTFSGSRQGGSTITQQLARNLYPDEIGRAPTLTRKLKEAITALKIEAVYSKPQILETYLNTVPFLYNAYGVEMAARTYFDKSADELDVLDSATLVGMLKGNSYYNPVLNPERALQRRNTVLGQMVKYGKLTPAQFEQLKRRPLRVDFERQKEPPGPAPHFAQQLRKWLIAWADRNDYNIYSDGLIVRTTIDARLQAMATQALKQQANALQGIANGAWSGRDGCGTDNEVFRTFMREAPEYKAMQDAGKGDAAAMKALAADRGFMRALCKTKTDVQAGFLAIDPRNGQIRAWVGSRDFTSEPFDHVVQARRQPGSTFKPFVYGAAFASGMTPDDTFIDQQVEIALKGGEIWRPNDDAPPTGKPMTLRDAIALSRNRITAQVMDKLGPAKVARLAYSMGVRDSTLERVPSLALGTSPVTLKEMVASYATIANGGLYVEPQMVTRIETRDGEVLAEFAPAPPERALDAEVDKTLVDVMRDVVDRGTGTSIRTRFGIRGDVAGKTGTTQDNADGWFILMQPNLVAGAWVGFDDGRVTLRSDYWGQGAHSALPIVGDVFQRALRARLIDGKAKFDTEPSPGWFASMQERVTGLFGSWFKTETKTPPTAKIRRAPEPEEEEASAASAASAPEAASGGVVEEWVPASEVAASAAALAASAGSAPQPPSNGAGNATPPAGSPPVATPSPAAPASPSAPEPADTQPPTGASSVY